MLAGIAPACATDISVSTGTPAATDCTPATSDDAPAAAWVATGLSAADAEVAKPTTFALTVEARPARSKGGTLNGVKLSATAVAPV
ncbi:hypothetical protein IWGMT90018_21360 [Mycobacterium kiyosense]|nr:hypothetical protein IWGMT90018_21360 [Mycobacterium kiyosense]